MSSDPMTMKPTGGALSPIMERHTPQHPLPEEIQNMQTDQTVCQFCGVSYLIHHEIKKLEEKVQSLEEELKQCRISRENEKKLKQELKKANDGLQSLQAMLAEKESVIDKMTQKIESQKSKMDQLLKDNAKLKDSEGVLKQKIRTQAKIFQQKAASLNKDLKMMKAGMSDLRTTVDAMPSKISLYLRDVNDRVQSVAMPLASEFDGIKVKCHELEFELESKRKNEDLLQNTIALMQAELQASADQKDKTSNDLRDELENLNKEISAIQSQNTELMQDVGMLQTQLKMAKADSVQMKEASMRKQQEAQSLTQKLHKTEQNADMTIQRMTDEIRHLENDLIAANKEREKWKSVEKNLQKQQDALKIQMSASSGQTQKLHESLEEAKQELAALKNERELMVMSHQSQIIQLRDSFREKLDQAQGSPLEMERRLTEQQKLHDEELESKANQWKENFAIELGLEREKHEEDKRNCIEKYQQIIQQIEADSKGEVERCLNESRTLQQQIKISKHEYTERMAEQEREKDSLKRMISVLEEKITQLTGEQEGSSITSRAEANEFNRKLQELEKEKASLNEENANLKEEIVLLQETVRRECEERFELTEALSMLREQLKAAKASPADSPVSIPVSAINGLNRQELNPNRLSAKTLKTLEIDHMSRSQASLPDVLPKNAIRRSSSDLRNYNGQEISPHVKDIGFTNHAPKVPASKSEESVESVRRRIANVIKRK